MRKEEEEVEEEKIQMMMMMPSVDCSRSFRCCSCCSWPSCHRDNRKKKLQLNVRSLVCSVTILLRRLLAAQTLHSASVHSYRPATRYLLLNEMLKHCKIHTCASQSHSMHRQPQKYFVAIAISSSRYSHLLFSPFSGCLSSCSPILPFAGLSSQTPSRARSQ